MIAVLISLDIFSDASEGVSIAHVVMECLVLVASLAGFTALAHRALTTRRQLLGARAEARQWSVRHARLLDGIGKAMDAQFTQWSLTAAEREVALFLVKGFSLSQIAQFRGTSERTARDQAGTVYLKASLGGRAELQAFFLEDILLPRPHQRDEVS